MAGEIQINPLDQRNLLAPAERLLFLSPADRARLFPTAQPAAVETSAYTSPAERELAVRLQLARDRAAQSAASREEELREGLDESAREHNLRIEAQNALQPAAPVEPDLLVPSTRTREEVVRDLVARSFGFGTLFNAVV